VSDWLLPTSPTPTCGTGGDDDNNNNSSNGGGSGGSGGGNGGSSGSGAGGSSSSNSYTSSSSGGEHSGSRASPNPTDRSYPTLTLDASAVAAGGAPECPVRRR
jgi:hypothetical protein